MRLLTAPFLLFPLLSAAAAQTTSPQAVAPAAPSTNGGFSQYRSDALHLNYSYPSSYIDAAPVVTAAFEASIGKAGNDAAKCISLPFSRMGSSTTQVGILLILRADAACLKKKFNAKSVADLAQGEAQGLASTGAKTTFGQPVNFQIGTRPATLLQGSFTLPTGQSMQAMVVCVLAEPDIACWQFLSNNVAGLSTMSTFPVTFDGSPATPLLPAGVLPQH